MTEQEYVRVSNRVRLTMAIAALNEVIPGDGINQYELNLVRRILARAEQSLFQLIDLEEE